MYNTSSSLNRDHGFRCFGPFFNFHPVTMGSQLYIEGLSKLEDWLLSNRQTFLPSFDHASIIRLSIFSLYQEKKLKITGLPFQWLPWKQFNICIDWSSSNFLLYQTGGQEEWHVPHTTCTETHLIGLPQTCNNTFIFLPPILRMLHANMRNRASFSHARWHSHHCPQIHPLILFTSRALTSPTSGMPLAWGPRPQVNRSRRIMGPTRRGTHLKCVENDLQVCDPSP